MRKFRERVEEKKEGPVMKALREKLKAKEAYNREIRPTFGDDIQSKLHGIMQVPYDKTLYNRKKVVLTEK